MASGNFNACLACTLREEGGYSNVPADPGGSTQKGVTQKTYDLYRARKRLATRDVRQMTDDELREVYRAGYWDAVGAEGMPPGVDLSAFDYAVNSGPARAKAAIAKAAAGGAAPAAAIRNLANARLAFLHGLATWQAFGKGWGPRVARIEAASLRMAGQPVAPAAAAAKATQDRRGTNAKAAGAAAAAAVVAHAMSGGHSFAALALIALIAGVGAAAAWSAWRQGQRGTALTSAASTLTAQSLAANALAAAAKAAAPAGPKAAPPHQG